ncbi:hypothetical protein CANCADRAFT_32260 [Tortispora caseinolytica NRRL Y-17796]|uniref:Uncharacterized protein n=1 Tax=Tortispora caseinolytica NRRL Y-17796 TaxID=767744 RepID=A0A1E4TAL7_9ASCO|nr:hypothetical protein CANCADRAFT_32260 [Tortispora caseinolytica NRRL Y-17796]
MHSIDYLLGVSFNDTDTLNFVSNIMPGADLVPAPGNRSTVAYDIQTEGIYTVEEALSLYFTHLLSLANDMLEKAKVAGPHSVVRDIAVTVPPNASPAFRRAIRDAAEISGVNLVTLVDDGLAVALKHVIDHPIASIAGTHLIFDMGAGTTSATVVRLSAVNDVPSLEVLSANTLPIGGDRITLALADRLKADFEQKTKTSITEEPRALNRLIREAERAKVVLSANTDTRVSIESLYNDLDLHSALSRSDIESSCGYMVPQIESLLKLALADAGIDSIDSLILFGGSTRVPFVQEAISSIVGSDKISRNVNADEAAVNGAAYRGTKASGQFRAKEVLVSEPLARPLTLNLNNGQDFVVLAEKNQKITSTSAFNATLPLNITSISLLEGNFLLETYELPELASQVQSYVKDTKLENNSTVSLLVKVSLGEDKIASVTDILLHHTKSDGKNWLFGLLDKPDQEEEDEETPSKSDDTKSSSSTTEASAKKSTSSKKLKDKSVKPLRPKYGPIRPMGTASKASSREKLRKLVAKDQERELADQIRNDLEAYTYKMKDFVVSHENALQYTTEDERKMFLDDIQLASDWLYGDGESASVHELKDKLLQLRRIEEIISIRDRNVRQRPEKLLRLETLLDAVESKLADIRKEIDSTSKWTDDESGDEIPPWNPEYVDDIEHEVLRIRAWLTDAKAKQQSLKPHQDSILSVDNLDANEAQLNRVVSNVTRRRQQDIDAFKKSKKAAEKAASATTSSTDSTDSTNSNDNTASASSASSANSANSSDDFSASSSRESSTASSSSTFSSSSTASGAEQKIEDEHDEL